MGTTRLSAEQGSHGNLAPLLSPTCYQPVDNHDLYGTVADPTTISVGDDLIQTMGSTERPAGESIIVPKTSIHFSYNEAAGNTFAGVIRITGIDNYGELQVEDAVVSWNGPNITGRAYIEITELLVVQWDNADAADDFSLGQRYDVASDVGAKRTRIGFPHRFSSDDDFLGLVSVLPLSSIGLPLVVASRNFARGNFTVAGSAVGGVAFAFVMNPENPKI